MTAKTVSIPKKRDRKTRMDREKALHLFLLEAPSHGVTDAWIVGSMATNKDHPLSDVDLCIQGNYRLETLYSLRDKTYLETGVIIQLITEHPRNPKVKIIGS